MPYLKRLDCLQNTLKSFNWHYNKRNDYEIIIVEDRKNVRNYKEHHNLKRFLDLVKKDFNIIQAESQEIDNYNPADLYNIGAEEASGEFLVITSPECFHDTNILDGFDEGLKNEKNQYIICACKNVENLMISNNQYVSYHPMKWYQHSVHNNKQFHFCSCISKENYTKMGGFDSGYSIGIGYEDNDFQERVWHLGGIQIINRDDLVVLHQNHPKESVKVKGYKEKLKRNLDRFKNIWGYIPA
jgi:hypothetical protein